MESDTRVTRWQDLQCLDDNFKEQLMNLYHSDLLPLNVRHYLAHWIEAQDWDQASREVSLATVLLQNLLQHVDDQLNHFTQEQEILEQHNFRKFKHDIQAKYQEFPLQLAAIISRILKDEENILSSARQVQQAQADEVPETTMETGSQIYIRNRVVDVRNRMQTVIKEVKSMELTQEAFDFRFNTFKAQGATEPQKEIQVLLQATLNKLDQMRKNIVDALKELLGRFETLLNFLREELGEWARQQQRQYIGAPVSTSVTQLESWITATAVSLFHLRQVLKSLMELSCKLTYDNDPLKLDPAILERRTTELISCLLASAFVVENQPIMSSPIKRPLVLKTNVQFSVRTRFLVKLPELNHVMTVTAVIDKNPPKESGYRRFNVLGTLSKVLNMDDVHKEGLTAEFKHLTLKEQKAGVGGKGGKGINDSSLAVTEELHNISFIMKFNYQGLLLDLETSTLPLVIISNVSQIPSGWASMLWFNMLCSDTKNLLFFSNPPAASWTQLGEVLSWQFSSTTKRGLDEDQLSMLAEKLCGNKNSVSWSKFCKDNMPNSSFTFWTWIDGILQLIQTHLENIWNDGLVMGFVSRKKEKSLLKKKMDGTFLLRFSESCRDGGITFTWVEFQGEEYNIRSVQPYTKTDLSSIPLTEIIRNFQLMAEENIPENPLKYLYPDIKKDIAFGKYYEHRSEVTNEYKKYLERRLIMVSARQTDNNQMPQVDNEWGLDQPDFGTVNLPSLEPLLIHDCDPMMPMIPFDSLED
ncbi:signal transducer and activator of transcription 2 [Microcaecilia unicolor]|uniref:Signal transducer and activator of transcription n=1 Tax=Microcaecilia unicolor TaxID=1415580 RepID=A0A6P7XAF7_9AMPH|nr:signal transducer and activator of transcription 2 [Microcaecilia unicolor]